MQLSGHLGNAVSNYSPVVLTEPSHFSQEEVSLTILPLALSLYSVADDQWDPHFTFPAHSSSVNSISWAALHSGNDYFVNNKNLIPQFIF